MLPDKRQEGAIDDITSAPVEAPVGPGYRPVLAWFTVAILVLFQFISLIDRQIIAILADSIKADLAISDFSLSLLQGLAFALFYSFAGIPIGAAIDRWSRRFILWIAISFWSVSAASCGLASSFVTLFLGRVGVGAGEAALTPVATSLISESFPRGRAGTPMGLFAGSFYVGSGVALILGGWGMDLMTRAGVRGATFLLTAILMAAALPFFLGAYLIGNATLMIPLLSIALLLYSPMGAGAYASLQSVAPPGARGKVASLFVFNQALWGAALGPAGVGFITDYVLRDERLVGQSLAIWGVIVVPIGVTMLLIGRRYVAAVEE